MLSNSNSAADADYSEIAYLVAGRTVAAVVLGIEVQSLSLAETRPGEWEIALKFAPKCRKATIEEFAVIEICGRWAEFTVMSHRQIAVKNPTTRRGNPPHWLDKQVLERKAQLIPANYHEAVKQMSEQIKETRSRSAEEIQEAMHDRPATA